jgi:copper chaperone NosL
VAFVHYLFDRFQLTERRLIWVAALVLVPVFFLPVLPIWVMKLWAPQYREGLTLSIYANTIRGDLQSINILNHYVGMKHNTPDDFREFRFLPQALTGFGLLALLAALLNRRWIAMLGWVSYTVFAGFMFNDYARWLWQYGHDLDPRAPIKLPLFTPPLIGLAHMANFHVLSVPGPGTLLLGLAWLLGPLAIVLEMRETGRAKAGRVAA